MFLSASSLVKLRRRLLRKQTAGMALFLLLFLFMSAPGSGAFTATPGTGSVTVYGGSDQDAQIGFVTITVNGVACQSDWELGDLPWDVATRAANNLNSCNSYVTASVPSNLRGASQVPINITANSSGSGTNYSLSVSSYVNGGIDDPEFTFSASGSTLTGGHN